MEKKTIYFAIDDSGKIDDQYDYSFYGGLVFLNGSDRSNFIRKYSNVIKSIKCSYCNQDKSVCSNNCPEVKSHNINSKHRRQLLGLIKSELCIATIINKSKISLIDIKNKKTKRRFLDYAIKRVVKSTLLHLLRLHIIDKNDDIAIILNIDNESRSTNGIYDLQQSIYTELFEGVHSNGYFFPPIITGKLSVLVNYRDSRTSYDVQAADILAGTIRRKIIHSSFQDGVSNIQKYTNIIQVVP